MKLFKYVSPVADEEYFRLEQILNQSTGELFKRIKGILLSIDGYVIDEIAEILNVHRDTVSIWIDLFEKDGVDGLKNKPGRGRKSILTESEQKIAVELVKKHPTNIKIAIEAIKKETGKNISIWTLKRILKRADFEWKRIRKSLKSKQDPEKVEQAKKDIEAS